MTKSRIIGTSLLSVIIISIVCWVGYQTAFKIGEAKGYTSGYEESLNSFPQLAMDNVTFSDGKNTIYFSQLTIIGEQHIIDIITDLPNISHIISFK